MSEANARIVIDKLLREAGWVLPGNGGTANVEAEVRTKSGGFADYLLKNSAYFPLCIIEAKKELVSPLDGKEQARRYAKEFGCRFVILTNSVSHYLWDIEQGSPIVIDTFPTQKQLLLQQESFNPPRQACEDINEDYIAQTQSPNFHKHPDYLDRGRRDAFIKAQRLRLLRPYQIEAIQAVQMGIREDRDRFLLEMATGTGKTLTSSALIKMFIRLYNVERVLFLVDRLELEMQAKKEFDAVLKNDFRTVIWKENKSDWEGANIVVSTVQSFISQDKYRRIFNHDHFGLVISDEAHRSLGARGRRVFEYFIGFKLGLTATPKDYLKSVDIAGSDPKELEMRLFRDTYTTFGCENSEPTFRYSLEDGVRDGHLVNPKVLDARTDVTKDLLSETGLRLQKVDDEGNEVEVVFTNKDFEKRLVSNNSNRMFCKTFLEYALRDPYTGEIGKTLIFCVTQKHAGKIVQMLNQLADEAFPDQYASDFAFQVTSNIRDAQRMTVNFRNNNLGGRSTFHPDYRTSKARVCVTVGMMTTGYDCTDLLNICMLRPIFSPSEFVQMKGRGTRRHDFSQQWIDKAEIPDIDDSQKEVFYLFDFFGNYKYFEKDFDYDEVVKLPTGNSGSDGVDPTPINYLSEAVITTPDSLASIQQFDIPVHGMRVDRDLYGSFRRKVSNDEMIKQWVKEQKWQEVEEYLDEKIFNKPEEYLNMDKIRKSLGIDRPLTISELLLYVFEHIDRLPTHRECLDEEFEKFDKLVHPEDSISTHVREAFEAYAVDGDFRDIIDNKRFARLSTHTSWKAFQKLPPELREKIPEYINEHVNLERLENVG